ncbi:transducin beta-like protein 3 [Schistocerca nitens]|uniref:transducin beta-like protein 3 n=1 Tax=Schistocerca nitens TaxID=7011 RepID=UPI002118DD81|nr:transducin beta-like protein 3 [Schistocerca nitens]
MVASKKIRDAFDVDVKHGAFFTGGYVEWTSDGKQLLCQSSGSVNVLNVEDCRVVSIIGESVEDEDEDPITALTLSSDNEVLVTSHRSGLFKQWKWKEKLLTKVWKSIHKGPVSCLALDNAGGILASGGSDASVRLWDVPHHTCSDTLRGGQGVVSVLKFRPLRTSPQVFAASDYGVIHGWGLQSGLLEVTLTGHFSKVTDMTFDHNSKYLISCGRDKILILWDVDKECSVRTVPVYESLESLVLLPQKFSLPNLAIEKGIHIATAGEKGKVRVWDVERGCEVYCQENPIVSAASEDGGLSIIKLMFCHTTSTLAVISYDHNIILHSLNTFMCEKQLAGFSDEILDVVFVGEGNSHLAVATNSIDIKLYKRLNMDCQLLRGHSDLVLGLASCYANARLLLSCAKDNSVRLWIMDAEQQNMTCVGSAVRHTASVGSVVFSRLSDSFFLSVSQDSCVKLWEIPEKLEFGTSHSLNVTHTEKAHQKDINCVCISPNDKLIATGSQDKSVKLWSAADLSLLGVMNGHRKGVWCVQFSPVDKVVVSSSADCSIKLWAISDLSCIKTLEGHESSVLRVEFLNNGMQLVSSGADGLLKIWSVKTSECVATMDQHAGRVWALAVSSDESHLVTGGSDSTLVVWRDVSDEKRAAAEEASQQLVLQEQQLNNLLQTDHLLEALQLALSLNRPRQVLSIVQDVLKKGQSGLEETLRLLNQDQKQNLLNCVSAWNCNSKNCHVSQAIISVLLEDVIGGSLTLPHLAESVEGLLPYTERHFRRLTQLVQDLHLLHYTTAVMEPHSQ